MRRLADIIAFCCRGVACVVFAAVFWSGVGFAADSPARDVLSVAYSSIALSPTFLFGALLCWRGCFEMDIRKQ